MIGLIKHENYIQVEFWPIFGSEKGIPRWANFTIPYSPKNYGEYGISWNGKDVYIQWGNATYCSFRAFFKSFKHQHPTD